MAEDAEMDARDTGLGYGTNTRPGEGVGAICCRWFHSIAASLKRRALFIFFHCRSRVSRTTHVTLDTTPRKMRFSPTWLAILFSFFLLPGTLFPWIFPMEGGRDAN